jgi:transcriptional regulator with XRE-family HTH domain
MLHLRFFKGMTQSDIAAELGISQMHVSRLLAKTLAQLRAALEAAGSGRRWDESEAQALVASLRYARALPLAARELVRAALGAHLIGPLAQGEPIAPERAAREAATAIDEALRGSP